MRVFQGAHLLGPPVGEVHALGVCGHGRAALLITLPLEHQHWDALDLKVRGEHLLALPFTRQRVLVRAACVAKAIGRARNFSPIR